MYHRGSSGGLSDAEFRHLGKIVVRDCIGFQSVGHAFCLEDGSETRNLLDRNLGVLALRGAPLPEQALPFDQDDGAAFWWSNSLNAFTRNVAVECDQHGYRFEVVASGKFNPVLPVLQPDGSRKPVDIRTLPLIRFDDNEAHTQRRFGINLGGFNGLSILNLPDDSALKDVDDNSGVAAVTVNGSAALPLRTNFAEWEAIVPASPRLTALSLDAARNEEKTPHLVEWDREGADKAAPNAPEGHGNGQP